MECGVIRDLIPLYADGVASEESRALVDEHVKTCDTCRAELGAGSAVPSEGTQPEEGAMPEEGAESGSGTESLDSIGSEESTESEQQIDLLQAFKKKLRHRRQLTALFTAIAVVVIAGAGLGIASVPRGIPYSENMQVSDDKGTGTDFVFSSDADGTTVSVGGVAVNGSSESNWVSEGTVSVWVYTVDTDVTSSTEGPWTLSVVDPDHPKASAQVKSRSVDLDGSPITLIYVGFSVAPISRLSSTKGVEGQATAQVVMDKVDPLQTAAVYYLDHFPKNVDKLSDDEYIALRDKGTILWRGLM